MRHAVGQVEEERPIPVAFDEGDSPFCVARGELCLIFTCDLRINDLVILEQREVRIPCLALGGFWRETRIIRMQRPHVIGVGQAQPFIEALSCGKELRLMTQMPLAGHAGGVTQLL